jgi:CubicO group peptidase (beta-lactamase class C family)
MSDGGFSKARLAHMQRVMAGHVESGALPGLVALVSRRGETHVDAIGAKAVGASDPMRRDTIFRVASMTKPVAAAAAMILVEECVLRLDEPVDRFLPELANRKVLKRIDADVDDTVPARRPISLRDLLTFRCGLGFIMAPPSQYPIQKAIAEAGLQPGPLPLPFTPDEFMKRLGGLPLVHQPGEKWLYHTGSDILGVLIARAAGQSLDAFLRERIFTPLGMNDTGFHLPAEKLERLPTAYGANPETRVLEVFDDRGASRYARPPVFHSGGGGLVSTADDYLAFCRMMLAKGRVGRERILSRPSVELMTSDQLTQAQRLDALMFLGETRGWGFGMAVVTRRDDLFATPGRFGWDGGYGTSGYSDPAENLVGILLTQRLMESPEPPRVFVDFWTSAYQAIDD